MTAKVAIVGFGRQGLSAYNYYKNLGAEVAVRDQKEALENAPPGAELRLGDGYLEGLAEFDIIVRTPFLQPQKISQANPDQPGILKKVTTATNEFFKLVKTPIIAVTGTKGKGTTCLLIEAFLKKAGLKTVLMGNIGVPPLDVWREARAADAVVFEIASFQSLDLRYSPQIGVCLNISPEHLDWHADYDDYLDAKAQLFAHQNSEDYAVYAAGDRDSQRIVSQSPGRILSYGAEKRPADVYVEDQNIYIGETAVARTSDIKLLGRHNRQNVCAAIAAAHSLILEQKRPEVIAGTLRQIEGFPSRLEPIRTLRGIAFIDDSYASAPEASMAALEAVAGPKILIAGGHDKGVDLEPFVDKILESRVKHLIAIGQTGPAIEALIKSKRPDFSLSGRCRNMAEIIDEAMRHARAGDTVLLSTACASFGMFKNYDDRAEQFKRSVSSLK